MAHENEALGPIEQYLSNAKRMLSSRLPAWMVDQRLAEAREHLTQCTEELAAEGMPTEQAQATAVSAFGPAKEWVKSIAEAAYADTGAIKARRGATIAGIVAITAALCWFQQILLENSRPPVGTVCAWVFVVALLVVSAGAFRGGRSAMRALMLALAGAVLALFLATGITFVDGPHGNMARKRDTIAYGVRVYPLIVADEESEMNLLRLGVATYDGSAQKLPETIPTALRTKGGGYIVPKPLIIRNGSHETTIRFVLPNDPWMSAFKVFTPAERAAFLHTNYDRTTLARLRVKQAAQPYTVPTEAEAARDWRAWGSTWLEFAPGASDHDRFVLMNYRLAAAHPYRFGWQVAATAALFLLFFGAPVVLLDRFAALIGRWAFRRRRGAVRPASA